MDPTTILSILHSSHMDEINKINTKLDSMPSLRDQVAMAALQGILTKAQPLLTLSDPDFLIEACFKLADVFMKQRDLNT